MRESNLGAKDILISSNYLKHYTFMFMLINPSRDPINVVCATGFYQMGALDRQF